MFGLFKRRQPVVSEGCGMMVDEMNKRLDTVNVATMPAFEVAADPIDEAPAQPEGLQRKWLVGERMPWKGIWFRVASVEPYRIVMVPEVMTAVMAKKVEAAKRRE